MDTSKSLSCVRVKDFLKVHGPILKVVNRNLTVNNFVISVRYYDTSCFSLNFFLPRCLKGVAIRIGSRSRCLFVDGLQRLLCQRWVWTVPLSL